MLGDDGLKCGLAMIAVLVADARVRAVDFDQPGEIHGCGHDHQIAFGGVDGGARRIEEAIAGWADPSDELSRRLSESICRLPSR